MKRKMKHMGLIMGAAMMTAVTGAGTALAADQPAKAQKPAVTSAPAENKGQGTKTDQKKEDVKKETLFYGKVKKLEKDKLVIDEAAVVWAMDIEEEKESPAAKTEKKDSGKKDAGAKDANSDTSVSADFETGTMKWKLVGKTLEIKTDKDTKYVKSIPEDDKKTGNADAGTANEKKAEASGKSEETDQKGSKAASSEGADTVKSTAVEQKDIQEGMFLRITVKEAGSLIASEVLVLSDTKEIMPDGQEGTDKAGQAETKKDTAARHS